MAGSPPPPFDPSIALAAQRHYLAHVRVLLERKSRGEEITDELQALTRILEQLDLWLSGGGRLPAQWARARPPEEEEQTPVR